MLGFGFYISWEVTDNNHYAKAHRLAHVWSLCFNFTFATVSCKPLGKLLNMSRSVFSAVTGEK